MKVVIIDPSTQRVDRVDLEYRGIDTIYALVGCDTFDAVYIDSQNTAFVDDEGLINGRWSSAFSLAGSAPLAGRALVVGTDEEGGSTDVSVSPAEVEALLEWVSTEEYSVWLEKFDA